MGIASSQEDEVWEHPSEKHQATLYYFGGRGLADQLRWMMAATNVTFTQKVINQRGQFERMARRQLPFGQLPLLQIDDLEIVQSQAAVRYLARRANIQGTGGLVYFVFARPPTCSCICASTLLALCVISIVLRSFALRTVRSNSGGGSQV